jgi:hypothetical protein
MNQDLDRLYKAIIFTGKANDSGEWVSVYAKNLVAAKDILDKKYGIGTVFDLHNEEDANAAR